MELRQMTFLQRMAGKIRIWKGLSVLAFILLFLIRFFQLSIESRSLHPFLEEEWNIRGTVCEIKQLRSGYDVLMRASALTVSDREMPIRHQFRFFTSLPLKKHAEIILQGKPEVIPQPLNPGDWNAELFYKAKNVFYQIRKAQVTILKEGYVDWRERIAEYSNSKIRSFLPKEEAALFIGIFLGQKNEISSEWREEFKKAGIAHILAISGLHIGFLYFAMRRILKKLPLRFGAQYVLTMGFLCLYIIFTGMSASAIRTFLMLAVNESTFFFYKPREPKSAFVLVFSAMLLFHPFYLFDIGFQFSFVSVAIILFVYPFLWKKTNKALSFLQLSLTCQIFLIPLYSLYYQELSLIAILTNVFMIPMITFFISMGVWAFLLSMLSPWIAKGFIGASYFTMKLALEGIFRFNQFTYATIPMRAMLWQEVILFFGITVWAVFRQKKKILWLLLFVIILFIPYEITPKLTMLDVGQAESMVLEYKNRTVILDAGLKQNRSTVSYLKYKGKWKIETILLSHLDADHIGGLAQLLETYPVEEIGISEAYRRIGNMNFSREEDKLQQKYEALLEQAKQKGVRLSYWKEDDVLQMDDLQIRFLYPGAEDSPEKSNDFSFVAELDYYGTKVLFTGDIGLDVEEKLIERGQLSDITLLKVAHHGSKYASRPDFLKQVKPELAIISCGRYNRYGHPATQTLDSLRRAGARTEVTFGEGAIQIELSKQGRIILYE